MFTAGAIALYGVLGVAYVAMIVTTERSAANYTAGKIAARPRAEVTVPLAPATPAAEAPRVVSTHPSFGATRPAV